MSLHRSSFLVALLITVCTLLTGCERSNDEQFADLIEQVRNEETSVIDIRELPLTDDSQLAHLASVNTLTQLNLDRSPVTDEGLKSIGTHSKLGSLSLTRTLISGEATSVIVKQFPNLIFLRLDETAIRDEDLEPLAKLPQLDQISLYRTRVTDAGCIHLASISTLTQLSLDGTMITDEGLQHFESCDNLVRLSVWNTQVSDEGVKRLQESQPKLLINH